MKAACNLREHPIRLYPIASGWVPLEPCFSTFRTFAGHTQWPAFCTFSAKIVPCMARAIKMSRGRRPALKSRKIVWSTILYILVLLEYKNCPCGVSNAAGLKSKHLVAGAAKWIELRAKRRHGSFCPFLVIPDGHSGKSAPRRNGRSLSVPPRLIPQTSFVWSRRMSARNRFVTGCHQESIGLPRPR